MTGSTRDDGLDGKVAVISGAASGIGQALAIAYARAGANTVAGYFPGDPHDVADTVAAVEQAGGTCLPVAVDVRSTEQCDSLAEQAVARFGAIDIVVASAGILRRAALDDLTDELWDDMLSVDLTGVLRLFRSTARVMTGPGAMVSVSSIAGGVYGWEEHAHYAAAKSGLLGLCRSLATELAPLGIRVNTVIPGLIESPQSLDAENSLGAEGLAAARAQVPLGRIGTSDELARTVRFLTSDDAGYVTGQQLIVDGGLTVRWPS